MPKHILYVMAFLLTILINSVAYVQDTISIHVELEPLAKNLYLDGSLIPTGFDREILIRLNGFLEEHIVPDCHTPFPEHFSKLPIIVRYTPFSKEGQFPLTAEGYGGWCDVVIIDCEPDMRNICTIGMPSEDVDQTLAFLTLIAIPESDGDEYLTQLWGITGHEIAHAYGAVDGPRCPFYDDIHLPPENLESDTYYWFGIAGVFKHGWQGIINDALHNTCEDDLCIELRNEVFDFK